jgi:hypothetical protein
MRRMEEEIEILRLTSSRADLITMNNIGPSATSRAAASYSAAYSYLGHRWMTTFRSAEDVKTSLAMIRGYSREMGHELKARFRGRHLP